LSVGAYAGLSHYCNSVAGARDLGAAMALAPLAGVALALAWRWMSPLTAALATAGLAGVLYYAWPLLTRNFTFISLVQDSGVYGLLGLTFARSLMPSQVAMCTQLADKVHGPLSPREVRYTRGVTVAWTLFFFGIAALSVVLYAAAPLRVWSFYINFCGVPLIGAMFIAEYLVRRRALPGGPRAGLLTTVRVYFANPR